MENFKDHKRNLKDRFFFFLTMQVKIAHFTYSMKVQSILAAKRTQKETQQEYIFTCLMQIEYLNAWDSLLTFNNHLIFRTRAIAWR